MDNEMIAELEKAYTLAYQYRKNTLRIRRLLDQSPITFGIGDEIISSDGYILILCNWYTKERDYINPILVIA